MPLHIINKLWISSKNDKAVKIMKKTQILLWKAIEGNSNRRLRFRVRVRFLLFYSELAPLTRGVTCSVTLLGWEKYEEAMSDEPPWNIRNFCFPSFAISLLKYKKKNFRKNMQEFFKPAARKFHFPKYNFQNVFFSGKNMRNLFQRKICRLGL